MLQSRGGATQLHCAVPQLEKVRTCTGVTAFCPPIAYAHMRGFVFLLSCLIAAGVGMVRAGNFGFESLRELVEERRVTSVEGLIAALPEDLRAHYALVFSSRSLQEGRLDAPRVILFGSDAHFIVTFNGDASQRGYSTIETLEFDVSESQFVLREVTFSGADGVSGGRISLPNPHRCLACHDQPARPIWDVPPVWPGAYGERYHQGLSSAETNGVRQFLHVELKEFARSSAAADRRQLQAKGLRLLSGGSAYDSGASPIELTELRFLAESGRKHAAGH